MSSLTDQVDALFARWDRPDSPGCALGVIQNGEFVYRRGYGMANLEHDVPISSTTVFRVGSLSKQFTAASVALLAERGQLSLDDDVRRYLPELPTYGRPITVRHLIHHTSGVRDYLELMSLAGMGDDDFYTDAQVIEMIARQQGLNFAPGDEYLYSNSGYYLLGLIVKRVSGQSLRQFADENIFQPLGMANTHFHDDHTEIVRHRAAGYAPRDDGRYRIYMTALDMVGDGGLFTAVDDLLLWDRNLDDNRLGQGGPDLIQLMLTPGRLNSGQELAYAFGLVVGDHRGLKTVGHGGAFVGFRAEVIRFPEQRLSVICLANLSTFNPGRLARQVADVYLADHLAKGSVPTVGSVELPEQDLQDRAGVYRSAASGAILELSVQGGQLMADLFGRRFALAPVSATRFRALDASFDAEVEFEGEGPDGPRLVRLLLEDMPPDTLAEIEVASPGADQLAGYVGRYDSAELQVTYEFVLEGGHLTVRYRNAPQEPLKPLVDDMFHVGGQTFHFSRDGQDRVSGFTVSTGRVRNVRFLRRV